MIDGPTACASNWPKTVRCTRRSSSITLQAWYAKLFGARPGGEDQPNTSLIVGTARSVAHADSVSPTAGRAIDHIAFEIKDLESFCKKLAADGIKFDSPYQVLPQLRLSASFLTDPSGARVELTEGLAH
jgi:hypothetical protein